MEMTPPLTFPYHISMENPGGTSSYILAVLENFRFSIKIREQHGTKDTKLGEYIIPKGTEISLLLYINHISSENWKDPMKFDPDRFMDKSPNNPNKFGTYLPFSAGKRVCIGKLLATLEIKYLVTKMLLNYKLKKPTDFKVGADEFRGGVTFRDLPIIFEKRQD